MGGNGAARVTVPSPAWSMAALPDDRAMPMPETWPPEETVKRTTTSPRGPLVLRSARRSVLSTWLG